MDRYFHVYKVGRLTVIGFEARHLSEPNLQDACRDRLVQLINDHTCEVLVIDLVDITLVTSWVLGILAAVRKHGVAVELYHPSETIRQVLQATHLDEILHVRHDMAIAEQYSTFD